MKFFQPKKNLAWRFVKGAFCLLLIAQTTPTLDVLTPLSSSVYAASNQTESVQASLDRGAKLYREGKWGEAIQIWEKVLIVDPENRKAKRYIERAKQKLIQNKVTPKRSTPLTQREQVSTNSKQPDSLMRKGILLYRKGDYSNAIKAWNKALVKDPNNKKAKRYIERALKKQAELSPQPVAQPAPVVQQPLPPQPLKTETAPATELKNKSQQLLAEGKKLYREKEFEQAIKKWEKAVELDPMNLAAKRYIKRAEKELKKQKKVKKKETKTEEAPAKIVSLPIKEIPKREKETKQIFQSSHQKTSISSLISPTPVNGEIYDYGLLSLEEIIKLGLSNHGPSKVAREEVKLAKMRLIEARRSKYPGVNLKNGITEGISSDEDFEGLEFTAEFQLPIMTGGRIRNSIRQAEANVAVAVKNYEKGRADFVAELEQAYYALSNAKKVYRDRLQLFQEAKSALELIRKQFKAGLARQLDLLNIENQFNDVAFQITSAEKDLELAYLTLKQSMDLKENEMYDIEELTTYTIMDISYDDTLQLALKRRSDIGLAKLQVLFNKYAIKVAEAQNKLRVEMNASIGLNDQFFVADDSLDLQTEFFVGIRATKPLGMHTIDNNFIVQDRVPAAGQTTSSQFGSNVMTLQLFNNTAKTSITESRIQYMRAKGELKKAIKTTKFEVRQNFFEYQKALSQLDGAITRLNLGQEEVKILKAQSQLNQAQLIDVLRAQVRQYESRGNLAQAVTSYYTSLSNLNKAIGITGYYNPVTGEVSEDLHKQLFKPINRPRYKVFTQLTKDRPKEDILTLRPEEVTAEALLAKARKEERAYNNKWMILAPLKVVPGAKDAFMPEETREGLLNNLDPPPEKPLKPFKPWQVLRWPVLGLFEYEPVLDPSEENYKPEAEKMNVVPKKEVKESKQETTKAPEVSLAQESKPKEKGALEISSVEVIEDSQKVKVVLTKTGPLSIASYQMENPNRVLCVLKRPAESGEELKNMNVSNNVVQAIRFNKTKSKAKVRAFVIDLESQRPYQIENQEDKIIVAIDKEAL